MPDIATITFHWAENYGAVLQAYALQKYIKSLGFSSEIINYVPSRIRRSAVVYSLLHGDFSIISKLRYFNEFRNNELEISEHKYHCFKELKKCADRYRMIICGSDQIWNRSFTLHAEKKPTLSYFLGFAGNNTARLAYAVSFGADQMPDDYLKVVSCEVEKFQAVSVRELSGAKIAKQMGIDSEVVCDPTLLLEKKDYQDLLGERYYDTRKVFSYILHENQNTAHKISDYVISKYGRTDDESNGWYDVYEWIYQITYSEIVVTNSFHGVMLALIMNTNFIVIPVEGKTMNNRINTILSAVDLEDRIVDQFDIGIIDKLCAKEIDWNTVNLKLDALRQNGQQFLEMNLLSM